MSEEARQAVEEALEKMWSETRRIRREAGLCETCGEEPISVKQEAECRDGSMWVAYYGVKCWKEIRERLITQQGCSPEEVDASVSFNYLSLVEE